MVIRNTILTLATVLMTLSFSYSQTKQPQINTDSISNQNTIKPTIAILDFESEAITGDPLQIISDYFRAEIINTHKYIVVERTNVEAILKEQGFQQTGFVTDDDAVKIGNIIGVKHIILGTIKEIDNSSSGILVISTRLVDIESGEILIMVQDMLNSNDKENSIRKTINKLADKLNNYQIVTQTKKTENKKLLHK